SEPRWFELAFRRTPPWAAAFVLGILILGIGTLLFSPSRKPAGIVDVLLQASRGMEGASTASGPGRSPLALLIDLTELPSFPTYRIEVVNSAGEPVWRTTAT